MGLNSLTASIRPDMPVLTLSSLSSNQALAQGHGGRPFSFSFGISKTQLTISECRSTLCTCLFFFLRHILLNSALTCLFIAESFPSCSGRREDAARAWNIGGSSITCFYQLSCRLFLPVSFQVSMRPLCTYWVRDIVSSTFVVKFSRYCCIEAGISLMLTPPLLRV